MSKPHPDASAKIDAYIAALPDDSREVCRKLRAIVRKAAPGLVEDWKWGVPCFTGNSIVCGFAAFKRHVTFDFWNGALVDDRHGIFNHGTGNSRSHGVKLSEGDPIPERPLAECIREAAKLDAGGAKVPAGKARGKTVIVPEGTGKHPRSEEEREGARLLRKPAPIGPPGVLRVDRFGETPGDGPATSRRRRGEALARGEDAREVPEARGAS